MKGGGLKLGAWEKKQGAKANAEEANEKISRG